LEPEHPFTLEQITTAQAYCELMAEVKKRVDALREMLTPKYFQQWPGTVALECCYLQLRMISEGIALACLTANGATPGARAKWIRKEVSADAIMDALSKLHPEFYPIPERQERSEEGGWRGGMIRRSGFIKRRDLERLYGTCGNHLHVGSFEHRKKRAPLDQKVHVQSLIAALGGIVRLLEWHTIVTFDPSVQLWVEMAPSEGGLPIVKLVRVTDSTPEFLEELGIIRGQIDRHG
jgi:hypothetical protein